MSGLVLMENAGRGAAEVIRRTYESRQSASIVCGVGNNGGDGFVIARHLHNAGWSVRLMYTCDVERMTPDTRANYAIAAAMGLSMSLCCDVESQAQWMQAIGPNHVVIDGLLGTGFAGEVRSPIAELIHAINNSPHVAIVAIDVPSGLDCDTGTPSNATIRADMTVTFVAAKTGFAAESAAKHTGSVEVVDIGVPRELIEHVCLGQD